MKRRHNVEQVKELFEKIKTISPRASFGADIITGFPTETDEMFLDTKKTLERIKNFSHLHVFPYSEKKRTLLLQNATNTFRIKKKKSKRIKRVR